MTGGQLDPLKLSEVVRNLSRAVVEFPQVNWIDATSQGQLSSKSWLCDTLCGIAPHFGTAWVIGGWVGMLPLLLLSDKPDRFDRIITIDLDETACRAADRLLRHHVQSNLRFAACPGDAMKIDYRMEYIDRITSDGTLKRFQIGCQTIINTSWEHFPDPEAWFRLIPVNKLAIIQANTNPDAEGHVSCPANLEELCRKTPFRERLFSGALPVGDHHRLMTIGYV